MEMDVLSLLPFLSEDRLTGRSLPSASAPQHPHPRSSSPIIDRRDKACPFFFFYLFLPARGGKGTIYRSFSFSLEDLDLDEIEDPPPPAGR